MTLEQTERREDMFFKYNYTETKDFCHSERRASSSAVAHLVLVRPMEYTPQFAGPFIGKRVLIVFAISVAMNYEKSDARPRPPSLILVSLGPQKSPHYANRKEDRFRGRYCSRSPHPRTLQAVRGTASECLWWVLVLADRLGVDISNAFTAKMNALDRQLTKSVARNKPKAYPRDAANHWPLRIPTLNDFHIQSAAMRALASGLILGLVRC